MYSVDSIKPPKRDIKEWWVRLLHWIRARNDMGLWSIVGLIAILPAIVVSSEGISEGPLEKGAVAFACVGFALDLGLIFLPVVDDLRKFSRKHRRS